MNKKVLFVVDVDYFLAACIIGNNTVGIEKNSILPQEP